jgi:hypothetical protein
MKANEALGNALLKLRAFRALLFTKDCEFGNSTSSTTSRNDATITYENKYKGVKKVHKLKYHIN